MRKKKQGNKEPQDIELTATNLKNKLWAAFKGLESGELDAERAQAMARVAKEICGVTYLQVNASRAMGVEVDKQDMGRFLEHPESGKSMKAIHHDDKR